MLDLTNVSESGVQAGEYTVTCAGAEIKETKSGTGEYIKCVFETENGQKFFHNFNTKNSNAQAVAIGLGQLKTFMRVAGKANPNSLGGVGELLGLKCNVKVKVEENDYGTQARITAFKAIAAGAEPAQVVPF